MSQFFFPRFFILLNLIGLLVFTSCQSILTAPAPEPVAPTSASSDMITNPPQNNSIREVTILYTNDEHGWMAGMNPEQSAANLLGVWQEVEGYTEDGPFLILSGGDMWTGPAISTWFEGQSMVEVMNGIGYDAAAVGNHEFDFGLDTLQQRSAEAHFPFLSANAKWRDSGKVLTDLGIIPFSIVDVNQIRIGIIGLTTTDTPHTTDPANIINITFEDYELSLREAVPQVKVHDVDMIIVISHVCMFELEPLTKEISDLGIAMLGGGHCNELVATEANGIVLLEGGFHLTAYAKATFQIDIATNSVIEVDYDIAFNEGGIADLGIDDIITRWQDEAEVELNTVIGYTANEIPHRSLQLQDMVTTSWLFAFPNADIAITNLGGLRAPIPPGEIMLADIVGVMPFDNTIVEVQLTGAEVLEVVVSDGRPVIGGMRFRQGGWILDKTREPIDADATYSVLVNSFMYGGGDNFNLLAEFAPDGYNTGVHWRQPMIDWMEAQNSSVDNPIDAIDISNLD